MSKKTTILIADDHEYERRGLREVLTPLKDFEIVGDPEVGGLVTNARVDPGRSNIKAPGLRECVRETMYALELDAPEKGGKTRVSYPLLFRQREKPGSEARGMGPAGAPR